MGSVRRRPDGKWRARYRDPAGREHAKHFRRKIDADRWLTTVEADIVRGIYVDPNAGKVTVREYAEKWRLAQVHRPTSIAHVETMLRRHLYPTFGDRQLVSILPSEVQAWVRRLSESLAPSTVKVIHGITATIFKAAVADRRITASPCVGVRLPKEEPRRIIPPSTGQVIALVRALPDRYRAIAVLAAGTGLRQGEIFGLTDDRIDFLRRLIRVDRQLVLVQGHDPFLAAPKTRRSHRSVPLPDVVLDALAAHFKIFPPAGVTIRVGGPATDCVLVQLVFTTDDREPIRRTWFSGAVWQSAASTAGLPAGTGLHALRHYYASLLIRHGESVKTVQERLGHATAAETLDTYSHLWPDSDDRTREAIDLVLGHVADSVRTTTA